MGIPVPCGRQALSAGGFEVSLAYRPHTVSIETIVENVDDGSNEGRVDVESFGAASSVRGLLRPAPPDLLVTATALTLRKPHVFYGDTGDQAKFTIGSRLTYGSRVFRVAEPPELRDAGLAEHFRVLVSEEDPAI